MIPLNILGNHLQAQSKVKLKTGTFEEPQYRQNINNDDFINHLNQVELHV